MGKSFPTEIFKFTRSHRVYFRDMNFSNNNKVHVTSLLKFLFQKNHFHACDIYQVNYLKAFDNLRKLNLQAYECGKSPMQDLMCKLSLSVHFQEEKNNTS